MKKHLIIAFSAITVIGASSFTLTNDCSSFEQFTKGAAYTTTAYDANGKVNATVDCTVKDVTTNAESTVATITSVTNDKDGKQVATSDYTLTCSGTSYMMDMKSFAAAAAASSPAAKGMDMSIEGDMMDYPTGMTAGQSLPNGKVIMKMSKDGSVMSTTTVTIKDRKCEAVENKTTSAGTWSCYKISYVCETEMVMSMGMKMPMPARKCVEWFSFKVGPVRTESYGKNDKLDGYTELTKFTKPQ